MKKLFLVVAALAGLSVLTACHGGKNGKLAEGEFVIEGKLPAERYEGACIFLVPMRGPHPRPVDSTFVNKDGSFRFTGNVEHVAVLRLALKSRFGIQDLLVVTEPGVIHATLDSVSSGYGTPQNDSLQSWKEHLGNYQQGMAQLSRMKQEGSIDSVSFRLQSTALREEMGNYNYRLLMGLGRTKLAMWINQESLVGSLDSLRRQELNNLLRDTTDYSKPQIGFHK
ncbi:MAG: DUF4369 domain-containing protein [Bacteroidales bacterium]|nr:DUF4369 domain-containing protein [Bacteroidales bacterium]